MASMRSCNIAAAAVSAALGAVIAVNSYRYGIGMTMYGPGPGFWSFLLGVGLLVIAALLLIETVRRSSTYAAQEVLLASPANFDAYRMMALVTAYVVLVFVIGFYVSTFLFMLAAMHMLNAGGWLLKLGVTLIFEAFIYIVFSTLLHIALPLPIFMD